MRKFFSIIFDTWLIEVKVRGARPHNRRALHAAWLIPRACGSRKSHEESQATSEPPCLSSRSHTVALVVLHVVHVVPFNANNRDGRASSSLSFYSRHVRFVCRQQNGERVVVVVDAHKRNACPHKQTLIEYISRLRTDLRRACPEAPWISSTAHGSTKKILLFA